MLSFSFSWLKEKKAVKYLALGWAAALALILLLAALALLLFRETITSLLAGSFSTLAGLLLEPSLVEQMVAVFLAAAIPLFALFALGLLYIHALMVLAALRKAGLPAAELSPIRFIKLVASCIESTALAVFSAFNKKYLALLLAALVFAAATFVPDDFASIASGLLALLLLSLYSPVVFYNAVRQSHAPVIFLSKGVSVAAALKASWFFTEKRFWSIVAAWLALFLVSLALFALAFFAISLALTALFFYLLSLFSLAFQIASLLTALVLLPFALLVLSYAKAAVYRECLDEMEAERLPAEAVAAAGKTKKG